MTTTPADTSRPPFVNPEDEDLVRLRAALVEDREAQTALVMKNQAVVGALTGQRDVDSILEREMAVHKRVESDFHGVIRERKKGDRSGNRPVAQ